MLTITNASPKVLAEIREGLEAEGSNRPLTLDEIEAILPSFAVQPDELRDQLIRLRSYIADHDLELRAARQLRDRNIGEFHRATKTARLTTAELSGTSVPHVAACIGGRVPGAHLQ